MDVIRAAQEMQKQSETWRTEGKTVGFVPTMGFLHEGHLSLIRLAKTFADRVVVSLFVNPTQFGPAEDFNAYPRDEEGDLKKISEEKADAAFVPPASEMYPEGFQTVVQLKEITRGLCGASRPGHFDAVATVVLKLFHLVQPHVAVFGEKDYQQLAVIRRMVKDLNLPIKIVGGATVRSPEGLALSSRNAYLKDEEARRALKLSQAIRTVQGLFHGGETKSVRLKAEAGKILSDPMIVVEYVEIVDAETLKTSENVDRPARLLIAVKIGKTRLIDNGPVQT